MHHYWEVSCIYVCIRKHEMDESHTVDEGLGERACSVTVTVDCSVEACADV